MDKFFSVFGLSLALLVGCGADSGVTEQTATQTQQSGSASAAEPHAVAPIDNLASNPAAAADEKVLEVADDRYQCRGDYADRRCDDRCRYRGCRFGFCERGYYERRCICRRCY